MRITASVKPLLCDITGRPVRCSLKGEGGVVRSGIVRILGRVIAHIVSAVVPVDTINPFPNITPQTLDTAPNYINLTVCSGRSARETTYIIASACTESRTVTVTVATPNDGLHIVVGKFHENQHLNCGECGNVDNAPTRTLCFCIGTHGRSRLIYQRAYAGSGLVTARGLISTHIEIVLCHTAVIERGVKREPARGFIRNLEIFHISTTITAIPKLRDFHHYITRGQGFTDNAAPRVTVVEVTRTCRCAYGGFGGLTDSRIRSRPSGRGSRNVTADTIDFYERQLHTARLPGGSDRY